VKGQKGR